MSLFYAYNNDELCNKPHEYGHQFQYHWLCISITFVQNLWEILDHNGNYATITRWKQR